MIDRFVKPGEGKRVRVPAQGYAVLPPEGDFLPDDVWLRRRLNDDDVVDAAPPTAPDPDQPAGA